MQSILVSFGSDADPMHAAHFAPHVQRTVAEIREALRDHPSPREFYHVLEWRMDVPWTRETTSVSPYREIIAAYVDTLPLLEQAQADTIISLEATREMNMVGGRPSDCARSAVRDHQAGILTLESFKRARQYDH